MATKPSQLLAQKLGNLDPVELVNVVRRTVVPSNATNEEMYTFFLLAAQYGLNPLAREIYAFTRPSGGLQTVVSVDGWVKIINQHPDYDGMEFEYDDNEDGTPRSVTCRMYHKRRSHPVTVTEFYAECRRPTQQWQQMPRRMLRHRALVQCARVAFGISGIMDTDEAEAYTGQTAPPPVTVAALPPAPEPFASPVETAGVVDHDIIPPPSAPAAVEPAPQAPLTPTSDVVKPYKPATLQAMARMLHDENKSVKFAKVMQTLVETAVGLTDKPVEEWDDATRDKVLSATRDKLKGGAS